MKLKRIVYRLFNGFSVFRVYLAINITNECNRKCGFCAFHGGNTPKNYHNIWYLNQPPHLELERLKALLGRMGVFRYLIRNVAITGKGEPLLHPRFIEFCELFENYKIPFTITSNGDFLTEDLAMVLRDFEYLQELRVSVYSKRALAKIMRLSEYNFIKLFNMADEELLGMKPGFVSANYGVDHPRAVKDFNLATFCSKPFSFLTINTDGSVVPCYSYDEIGTIDDSFFKLWNGRRVRKYRKQAVNGRDMKYSDCKNCYTT